MTHGTSAQDPADELAQRASNIMVELARELARVEQQRDSEGRWADHYFEQWDKALRERDQARRVADSLLGYARPLLADAEKAAFLAQTHGFDYFQKSRDVFIRLPHRLRALLVSEKVAECTSSSSPGP